MLKSFFTVCSTMNYYTARRCLCRGLHVCNKKPDASEELKSNPYYKKYENKIAELQNASPVEFEERLNATSKKRAAAKNPSPKTIPKIAEGEIAKAMASFTEDTNRKPLAAKPTYTPKKTLDSLMKTDMLVDKNAEEITKIWQDYHKTRKGIYAVIPADVYETIGKRATEFPTFVFPIPRKTGYEFMMSQFSGLECHFTPLISFQAYGENAPICLTIIHYPELKDTKGIVLMCGEYDENVIQAPEAQCLANQLQMYYGGQELKKKTLLWTFTNEPRAFKHVELITELEDSVAKQ